MESNEVREKLIDALNLDLIGPSDKEESLENELLSQAPSRWYLTGFLVPTAASEEQKSDEDSGEEIDEIEQISGIDDSKKPDKAAAKRSFFPSSIGLSFLLSKNSKNISINCSWGDYDIEPYGDTEGNVEQEKKKDASQYGNWRRTFFNETVSLVVPDKTTTPITKDVPNSGGMKVVLSVRPLNFDGAAKEMVEVGTKSVSVFLVNEREPTGNPFRDKSFTFQTTLEVETDDPITPRPNLKGLETNDWDEAVSDIQFRNIYEYCVGHGVSTEAYEVSGVCRKIKTSWIPKEEVEKVSPSIIDGIELEMLKLSELSDSKSIDTALSNFHKNYLTWIDIQEVPDSPKKRKETGIELIKNAKRACARIKEGIDLLKSNEKARESFKLANKAMAQAARQRFGVMNGKDPDSITSKWRPFQLAFVLMNIPSIVDPEHHDRETVDLLFFPTGGGKTEAYLGLAAFSLVFRRIRGDADINTAGLCVLMRYTLRLLTLDQLGRAATLICALELERRKNKKLLGDWPFEIGLWVGQAATPNRMGYKGDKYGTDTARNKTIRFKNDDSKPSPIPIEECPWCGTKFSRNSFELFPNEDKPTDLIINCSSRQCDFSRGNQLPILAVDEQIYKRLPCFMIATVDKFAAMPWIGDVGGLFGKVQSYDESGFYGYSSKNKGTELANNLFPPELIIQDELHLISGPMGTLVGLYETALDELSTYKINGKAIRPKVIASTATVRRAEKQVRALFNRETVDIFPPPCPNIRDSFFAITESSSETNAREYIGIAAQGRSTKMILLRATLALMGAAQKLYRENGGKRNKENPVDPYMTLLGYFNSLRELGGSRRIMEDEVKTRLAAYWSRKRLGEEKGVFEDRKLKILADSMELTSRVSTSEVANTKRRLSKDYHDQEALDVVLATNMISVGLDITRLGLMVVMGQPKTTAEYIQSSSRVGRDEKKPGLVVALYNIHRHRDRSIYERFSAYHKTFYREVEATSVTPFSPRALDRGLAGTLISLVRHSCPRFTPAKGANEILEHREEIEFAIETIAKRAKDHNKDMSAEDANEVYQSVKDRIKKLLDVWSKIAKNTSDDHAELQYQREVGGQTGRLMHEFLSPDLDSLSQEYLLFRANRSMRDVETSINLWMKPLTRSNNQEDK